MLSTEYCGKRYHLWLNIWVVEIIVILGDGIPLHRRDQNANQQGDRTVMSFFKKPSLKIFHSELRSNINKVCVEKTHLGKQYTVNGGSL